MTSDDQVRERARKRKFRRAKQAVLGLAAFMILVCGGMVVTAAIDDMAIAKDRRSAVAEVIDVGTMRTSVRFREEDGTYHQPSVGLKYPTGLEAGENVRVEYSAKDPTNVKVAGRGWTLSLLPAVSSLVVALLITGALMGLVLFLERRSSAKVGTNSAEHTNVTSRSD